VIQFDIAIAGKPETRDARIAYDIVREIFTGRSCRQELYCLRDPMHGFEIL
jgi:hypothetical protein